MQKELILLYNLCIIHFSLTYEQIITMYQKHHVLKGWKRTFDFLAAKWRNTLNGQLAALRNKADIATVAIVQVTCNAQMNQKVIGP